MSWDKKTERGIWSEYVNSETGESSLKEIEPRVVKVFCKDGDHYFKPIPENQRELVCIHCGMGAFYIVGYQKLVNGKIITIKS